METKCSWIQMKGPACRWNSTHLQSDHLHSLRTASSLRYLIQLSHFFLQSFDFEPHYRHLFSMIRFVRISTRWYWSLHVVSHCILLWDLHINQQALYVCEILDFGPTDLSAVRNIFSSRTTKFHSWLILRCTRLHTRLHTDQFVLPLALKTWNR